MNKLLLTTVGIGILTTSLFAGVKKIYVGNHAGGYAQYVIECTNGNSYNSIHQRSDGYWYSGSMQVAGKGLSINDVAKQKCN